MKNEQGKKVVMLQDNVARRFKPGDIVRLMSGGPLMTVNIVHVKDEQGKDIGDGTVHVVWFATNGEDDRDPLVREARFHENALIAAGSD